MRKNTNKNVLCTLQKLFLGQCWFMNFQVMDALQEVWMRSGDRNVLFYCGKVSLLIWVHGSFVKRFGVDQWVVSIAAL